MKTLFFSRWLVLTRASSWSTDALYVRYTAGAAADEIIAMFRVLSILLFVILIQNVYSRSDTGIKSRDGKLELTF